MTETSPITFQTESSDSLIDKCSTVGRVYPHTQAKIINSKSHVVERGVTGELCVRGYSVMEKYWNDRKNTSKTIDKDQWLRTGDLA